ncbi:sugar MFS transporter [Sulfurimonas marina]|uniref:Sugar MFS transporter n=1 Tax=Sulfurimonas marina TaxID=2590551 RepID=A0A7M3V998_9BACT|nr:sugar MFS transporter [Sulfurimonas marina]QOP40331.1 sugar MFS transporter [Sulfurimonas marina]
MDRSATILSMSIIAVLFFIFGFVTWLNGSLIPFLKVLCDLNEFEALFVTFAFYISYTVMAYPMSYLLELTGYKKGMSLGLLVMAVGSLLFIPAAFMREFGIFLLALFVLGTGLTILQSASNPYIVLLGPIESAARRISIMGLINKSAGVLAPIVFTALILSDIPVLQELQESNLDLLSQKLVTPYLVMASILLALILFVHFSPLKEVEYEEDDVYDHVSIFRFPHVVLGAIALFFYVGIEVIAGDTIGLYAQSLGLEDVTILTSYTMACMVSAYLVGVIAIPKFLSQKSALAFSSLLGIVFIFLIVFTPKESHIFMETIPDTVLFVALLGLSNALVWPTIWPLVLEGLGRHTPKASALLIMSIAGGALLPLLFGRISLYTNDMQLSYLLGIVSYLFILFYALKGHRIGRD